MKGIQAFASPSRYASSSVSKSRMRYPVSKNRKGGNSSVVRLINSLDVVMCVCVVVLLLSVLVCYRALTSRSVRLCLPVTYTGAPTGTGLRDSSSTINPFQMLP